MDDMVTTTIKDGREVNFTSRYCTCKTRAP